jgi:hypothetical protein
MLDHQALHRVFMTYQQALNHPVRTFTIGGRLFDFNRYRYLVGVINLSTDSWYRESVCEDRNFKRTFPPRHREPPPSLARASAAGTCLQAWYQRSATGSAA